MSVDIFYDRLFDIDGDGKVDDIEHLVQVSVHQELCEENRENDFVDVGSELPF